MPKALAKVDPELAKLIASETTRQKESLDMIASENYPSAAVLDAVGSVLTAKYAEGYPGKRYYAGNQWSDQVELLAARRAKKLFGAEHVNVQPYSGTPANLAIYIGLLELGDTILGMQLTHGGHLSHGHKVSFSGIAFNAVHYGVDAKSGLIDYDEVQRIAKATKPRLIVSGGSAYPRKIDFRRMQEIAESVGALHLADISHIAGLVATGLHPSPLPFSDVVMTTTHKTLRGPRAAIIMSRADLAKKIDKAVFPGLQGGPHLNTIAGVAVALKEALAPQFKKYCQTVLDNSKVLAEELMETHGFDLLTGGTDNHLLVLDLRNKKLTGAVAEKALEQSGIVANKNTIPEDPRSPFDPSGLRLGTAAITSRGVNPRDMKKIAEWIAEAIQNSVHPKKLAAIKKEVTRFTKKLPLPGVTTK
jgi:glycine hydroxymethyltransferase